MNDKIIEPGELLSGDNRSEKCMGTERLVHALSSSYSALTSQGRSQAAKEAMKRPGKTNGLDRRGLRAPGFLRQRSATSSLLLMIGVILYALSLMWPLGSLSPSLLAYPLAIMGIGLILASLKSVWTCARMLPRRT